MLSIRTPLVLGLIAHVCYLAMPRPADAATVKNSGLAPEVTDLNAKDMSKNAEKGIPFLETPFLDPTPEGLHDGLPVGELGVDGGDREAILALSRRLGEGLGGTVDSFLLAHKGKLNFESYFRRGRINVPHYLTS